MHVMENWGIAWLVHTRIELHNGDVLLPPFLVVTNDGIALNSVQ